MNENCIITNDIFSKSWSRTCELRELIVTLKQSLKGSKPAILIAGGKKLQSLQSEIELLDIEIDKRLKSGPPLLEQERQILVSKKELQQEILQLNRTLLTEVKNIKSTLAGEMASLKRGRTALKGYGHKSSASGKVINKSL
ncbi:hypothetical protein [Desulforhopalus sp. IMCC35007]|uniref:hypothetical protein n=1 Tax=Desulforhopalus sp. IMCC35007 TaxID=2569543 RepID=UPI0010ADACEA|nr:hypothetical protein [Desulforhopalus sp. IMCC35007]TKB10261.1 hypothetical protein FCL48_06855 [Desulforhopalus sp. IMCC35007]